jgi:sugar/nucleoside kinase (ribokinase family)
MKKFHVYGMGAALVDTEIQVNDQDLIDMGVEKGLMTLVDLDRRDQLMAQLQDHLVHSTRASGGSAGNTIIAASYFGARTFFSGKVANDDNGVFYMRDMQNAGVQTINTPAEDGITGKCLILITPDAERSMNTFLGASESFSMRELDQQAIADSEYLYIESYLVTSDTGRAVATKARKIAQANNSKVAISFSDPGIIGHFREGVREIMGDRVNMIFCNKDEALSFADCNDIDTAIQALQVVTDEFVLTLGADGALVFDGNEIIKVEGVKVDAVDTNGAGDMFAGAYLYGISDGMSREQAGNFASAAAARVVSQFGPRLEAEQHQLLLEQFLAHSTN